LEFHFSKVALLGGQHAPIFNQYHQGIFIENRKIKPQYLILGGSTSAGMAEISVEKCLQNNGDF
jgi:hypothetical protein